MGSISIEQWRCRIGALGGKTAGRIRPKQVNGLQGRKSAKLVLVMAMLLVYADITQTLLIRSGIEVNPGPNSTENSGKHTSNL